MTVTCTSSSGSYVGGVVGRTDSANVNNCYNTGDVKDKCDSLKWLCNAGVGGVVGYQDDGTVENCYNTGAVTGSYGVVSIGGVVGIQAEGEATNCYFDSNKNQNLNGSGSGTNVEGKNSEAFASGEVTWLLSGGENQDENSPWRQNLASYLPEGSTAADTYPTLDSTHLRVTTTSSGYTNTLGTATGEDGYYEIYSAAQLYAFADAVNSGQTSISAKLMDNIDLSTVCGEAGPGRPSGKTTDTNSKEPLMATAIQSATLR